MKSQTWSVSTRFRKSALILIWLPIVLQQVQAATGVGAILGKGPGVGVYTLNRIEVTRTYTPSNIGGAILPGTTSYPPPGAKGVSYQVGWSYKWPNASSGPNNNSFIVTYNIGTPPPSLVPCVACSPPVGFDREGFSNTSLSAEAVAFWNSSGYGNDRDHTFTLTGYAGSQTNRSCCDPNTVGNGVTIRSSASFDVPAAVNNQTKGPPNNGEIRLIVGGAVNFGFDAGMATIEIDFVYLPGPAPCDASLYSIQPPATFPDGTGGTFNVGVTAPAGCTWSAIVQPEDGDITTAPIRVTSNPNGSGNGVVTITESGILPNYYNSSVVNIAGQMLTITEPPGPGAQPGGNYTINRIEVTRTYGAGFTAAANNTIGPATQTFPANRLVFAYEAGWDYFWTNSAGSPTSNRNRFVSIMKINQIAPNVTPGGPSGAKLDMRADWFSSGYGLPRVHSISASGAAGSFGPSSSITPECHPKSTSDPNGFGGLECITVTQVPVPQPDSNGEVRLVFIGTTDFENAGTVTVRVEVVYTRTGSGGGTPSTTSMSPTSGSGANQNFAFTVADSAGWQRLAVVDVLINNFLDGRHACFLAFVPTGADSGTIYLIDDAGDAGGPYATLQIPSAGSVQNSQCKISGSSVVATSGNSLTLALSVTFTSAFSGNKVVYVAAGDVSMLNTGWEVMGTWNVPGAIPSGPSVTGVTPAHSTSSNQIYTFAVGDTKGWQDIAVVDVLINSALNGIGACYVAFVPANAFGGSLYLVDNAGNAGGPYAGMLLPSGSSVSNGQCTIHGSGSSLSGAFGNTLMLTLSITFSSSFSGNKIVNVATVSKGGTNSGWQSVGTAAVP